MQPDSNPNADNAAVLEAANVMAGLTPVVTPARSAALEHTIRHCFVLEVLTNRLVSANASLSGAASLAVLKHSPTAPQSLWHERGSPGRLTLHSPVKSYKETQNAARHGRLLRQARSCACSQPSLIKTPINTSRWLRTAGSSGMHI